VSRIVAFKVKNIKMKIFLHVSLVNLILHMYKFRKKLGHKCKIVAGAYAWAGVNTGMPM
jgi:hypothetical protein